MKIQERYDVVLKWFRENMEGARSELEYSNAFELLVAVILSAQCTDKRVNMVTPELFRAYPDAESMSKASAEDLFKYISSISFPNSKADHLGGMARKLVSDYHGRVPSGMEELQSLPGVGRKTANVIRGVWFNIPSMPVDTHVFRVSARIGLTEGAHSPEEAERQLVKHIPEEYMTDAHHWILLHGRYVCTARKPKCDRCGISACCKFYNLKK